MNIVNTLTIRHIKTHKKRSILTILAIIVSVAMVTAVFTSAISFVKYFQNVALAIDGSWHSAVYPDNYFDSRSEFDKDYIDKVGVNLDYGVGTIKDDLAVAINACDENFLELRNVRISEGRMPKNTNELLIHRGFVEKNELGWRLGDRISLPIEFYSENENYYENKEFTIVGITDSNVFETDYTNGFVFATDDFIKEHENTGVYIRFSKLDNSVYEKTKSINKAVRQDSEEGITYNNSLLTYSGVTTDDTTLYILGGFCAIILAIIAIVSIFMIYDSFAVSYQERARYLGMLASVGATKKQKRMSIYFEGFILGLIGIPLGIIAGIGGIWVTFKAISGVWLDTVAVEYDKALSVSVNWIVILGTVIASAITIFVSSYIPARKASRTTAIDAIRQVNTVKVKNSKRLRTSKLATRLLGYEGALAVKNFKRNGRRSRNIVFALFMSVVVFLSVSNFSLMFSDVMKQSFNASTDISVSVDSKEYDKLNKVIEKASGIDDSFCIDYEYNEIDESLISADVKNLFTNNQVIMAFVDNATLDAYLNQLGEDTAKYHNLKKPAGILHNTAVTRDSKKKIKVNPLVDLEGKRLETRLNVYDGDPNSSNYITVDPIVGIQTTQDYNNEYFYYQDMHLPLFVMSIDMAPYYYSQSDDMYTSYTAYINCEDSDALEDELTELSADCDFEYFAINNATSQMNAINNILTIVKVFVFGFIALITLISILNIINTISNSMNERRREFAMIRSVGMTPKSFKKMIYYESFRYGLVSLLWSLPISVLIHFAMYGVLSKSYDYGFVMHPSIYLISIVAVFAIITVSLLYSIGKIKDDNIIETLKNDIN